MSPPAPVEDSRRKQILIGTAALLVVSTIILLFWLGRLLPGVAGEWFSMIVGLATTPFLMEASLLLLGFFTVLVINYWRRKREGDEFVYLERAEGPGSEELPEAARWALYREAPLESELPNALVLAEGAFEIGDHDATLEALAEMTDEEREIPAVLILRIKLARATGKTELAARLETKLAEVTVPD